jgi:dynein heavy chain
MSGEIIQLANSDSLIFEPMDLEAASPATVSRCGMIYMEPESLGWEPLLLSWLNTLPEFTPDYVKDHLRELFGRFVPTLLHLVRKGGLKEHSPTTNSGLVRSAMNLIDSLLDEYKEEKYIKTFTPNTQLSRIEGIFTFGMTWSLGASTDEDGRAKFDSLFKLLVKKKAEEDEKEGKERSEKINHPPERNLFNWTFIKEGVGVWEPWENELKSAPAIPREVQMNQIIVPTIDTVRYSALMKILVTHEKPLLIVGPTGTGKSVYITDFLLKRLDKNVYRPMLVSFSAQTSANMTQDIIMSKLDKRKKGTFGPPVGKKCK